MARQPFLAVPHQTREFDNKQRETALQAAHFSVQVSSNGGGNQVSRLLLALQKAMRRNCHILQIPPLPSSNTTAWHNKTKQNKSWTVTRLSLHNLVLLRRTVQNYESKHAKVVGTT